MREEAGEVFVQPDKNVLNLAAAGAEGVAHIVHRGIAYCKKIGACAIAKIQKVDGLLRQFGQGGIGIGAGGPLAVKRGVRFAWGTLSAQRMRESEIPSVGRHRA